MFLGGLSKMTGLRRESLLLTDGREGVVPQETGACSPEAIDEPYRRSWLLRLLTSDMRESRSMPSRGKSMLSCDGLPQHEPRFQSEAELRSRRHFGGPGSAAAYVLRTVKCSDE